jgi:hypothetical protein
MRSRKTCGECLAFQPLFSEARCHHGINMGEVQGQSGGEMIIQGFGNAAAAYATTKATGSKQYSADFQKSAEKNASGTQLTISGQAQALASSDQDIQARIDAIKAKPAVQRANGDTEFLLQHDKRFVEISAKAPGTQTAEDIDYVQKAGGLVNTMANLCPSEKKLYDDLVAKGDTEAVNGMNLVALSRMGGSDVTLGNGKTFNPSKTEITSANIRNLFSQMFVSADKDNDRAFAALASALDGKKESSA